LKFFGLTQDCGISHLRGCGTTYLGTSC